MWLPLLRGCVIVLLVCSYDYGVWSVYGTVFGRRWSGLRMVVRSRDDDWLIVALLYMWVYLCFWWVFVSGVVFGVWVDLVMGLLRDGCRCWGALRLYSGWILCGFLFSYLLVG